MTADEPDQDDAPPQRATHLVYAVVHFMRVVRHWRAVMVASLGACALLGALYYATATRLYQASASLLVLQTGVDVHNTSMTPEGMRQGLMPTYERLFYSAAVLEGALAYLAPEDRLDLNPGQPDNWVNAIRANLSASTIRQTNIIEVAYRSKGDRASVAVVNAVVRSYLDFMETTHKGTAGEIITALTKDKAQLEGQLAQKQDEVSQARQRCGDLGIRSDSAVVHPMVQRVVSLNEALIKAQQRRLELQASMAVVQSAVRNGENLQQHLLSLENSVGREVLLTALGFSSRDALTRSDLEKSLLEDEAQLASLRGYYGPMHPRVLELSDRVRVTRQYLADHQARIGERMNQMRGGELGRLVLQMVAQRLTEAGEHERATQAHFEAAKAEAVRYTGELERLQILEHDLKFLHDFRDVLLNKIASIDLKQSHGDIRTAVVSEPAVPKRAIWPKLSSIAVFSLAAGLGIGLCLVYLLDLADDRWRSAEELRSQLDAPLLALVPHIPESAAAVGLDAVYTYRCPNDSQTEAFHTLRTTLRFSSHDATRIVVTSAEPQDGKTTVLANLAVACARSGKKVLMIDADMRRPGLSTLLGAKGHGLSDLLVSSAPVPQIVSRYVRSTDLAGLDLLSAGPRRPNPSELLSNSCLAELLAWAETVYDQIFIDSPPVLVASDTSVVGRLVDGVVFVVQREKNRRRPVLRAAEALRGVGIRLLGIVVNRARDEGADGYGYGYTAYGHSDARQDEDADLAETPAATAGSTQSADAGSTSPLGPRRAA